MRLVNRYTFFGQTIITLVAALFFFVCAFIFWMCFVNYTHKKMIENTSEVLNVLQGVVTQEYMSNEYSVNVSRFLQDVGLNPKLAYKGLKIKEVFLLNTRGDVLAHSRAVRMSKIERRKYKQKFYKDILIESRDKAYISRITQYQDSIITKYINNLGLKIPVFSKFIKFIIPSQIPIEYLLSSISYNERSKKTIGSLNIIARPIQTSALIDPFIFYTIHYEYLIIFILIIFLILWKTITLKVPISETREYEIQNIEVPIPNQNQIYYQTTTPQIIYHENSHIDPFQKVPLL